MDSMQSMVSRLREEEEVLDREGEQALKDMMQIIKRAVDSGMDIEKAKEAVERVFGSELHEMSGTGGGLAAGSGASFTPGSGMEYAQGLDNPKKKVKEDMSHSASGIDVTNRYSEKVKSAKISDGTEVKAGDHVYYAGFPVKVLETYKKGGSTYIKFTGKDEDGKTVTDFDKAVRFKSKPPKTQESKDKEPKLAAGERKHIYDVDKFGFKPAPSIPNRKSTGGFEYKELWDESLQESYSKFRKAAKERDGSGQYRTGIGIVRKKLSEVSRMMEYLTKMKEELNTAGVVNERSVSRKAIEKISETIKSLYVKAKHL